VFDPIQTLETFFINLQTNLASSRLVLRLGAQTLVFGNMLVFIGLYVMRSLPAMGRDHSLLFIFVSYPLSYLLTYSPQFYSAMLLNSIIHACYTYEKARRTDSGNPEKISLAQGSSANSTTSFTIEEMRSFSAAFRLLLSHRDKGYVSLMHVQS